MSRVAYTGCVQAVSTSLTFACCGGGKYSLICFCRVDEMLRLLDSGWCVHATSGMRKPVMAAAPRTGRCRLDFGSEALIGPVVNELILGGR